MARVKYVGPIDSVYIDVLGDEREFVRGKAEEVPDGLVGRPPDPRRLEAMAELEVARVGGDHQWQRDLRKEIEGLDPGEGLLQQTDAWQLVEPRKIKKEDDQ